MGSNHFSFPVFFQWQQCCRSHQLSSPSLYGQSSLSDSSAVEEVTSPVHPLCKNPQHLWAAASIQIIYLPTRSLWHGCAANALPSPPVVAYNIKKTYIWCWDSETFKKRCTVTPRKLSETNTVLFCFVFLNHSVMSCRDDTHFSQDCSCNEGVTRWQMMLPCQYNWGNCIELIDNMKKSHVSCQEMLQHPTIF